MTVWNGLMNIAELASIRLRRHAITRGPQVAARDRDVRTELPAHQPETLRPLAPALS